MTPNPSRRWNPPPNWPAPPPGWTPPEGWQPDPDWGPAPIGWRFWTGPVVAVSTLRGVTGRKPQTEVQVDEDFVTIRRIGFDTRILVGKGEKRIPIHAITAVQWKPPGKRVSGFIEFSLGGGDERRSRFGTQTMDAAKDENSVVFTIHDEPAFQAVREAVEVAIANRHRPADRSLPTPDLLEQLDRLASLRDRGVLNEEEFAAQKARLLDRG